MKPGYLLIPAFVLFVIGIGCSKDNTGKKPRISLESINTTVQPNDSMVAMFKFTNHGGTLGNGTFVSIRNRLNQGPPADSVGPDTLYTTIPDFGGANNGEFRFALNSNDYLSEGGHTNDTLVFQFYALTPDSVSTDTISSPQIVIINP
jgi:hypothetical protein